MTDLRIADPVDQAMVADMGGGTPAPTLTAEQIDMLRKLGFDHVPTVEELREAKARRQAEVREEVLFQADRKHWCEDGTRTVCANLRLARPGKETVTMELEVDMLTWTDRGALATAINSRILPVEGPNSGGMARYTNVSITDLTVGGTPYELTEDLRKELTVDDA